MLALLISLPLCAADILFDGSHGEMSANADWVIDADAWDLYMHHYPCGGSDYADEANPQRYPTPDQTGVTGATAETYWTGGISAWAIELVKAGHWVETLPTGASITYGDGGNPQDLSNYDLFIVVEPNIAFTGDEMTAILDFVNAGGGLFMVADHDTSDRNCDGADSPRIFNQLMGTSVNYTSTAPYYDPLDPTSDYGLFGIWFCENDDDGSSSENKDFDWFTEGVNDNVETAPGDPVIDGPFGSGAGGLGFFGSTQMAISTDGTLGNPTALAHVWRNGQGHAPNAIGVSERVTFATAEYGAGRVAAIGDSSPADDGTGDTGDTLYDGWDKASGGVNNREIHLNACHWLLNPAPDLDPPVITDGPDAAPSDCTAVIAWTTDENATTTVEYGPTDAYGSSETVPGYRMGHSVTLTGLTASATYHYRVSSTDGSGNGPTTSLDAAFDTSADTLPSITAGPSASGVTHQAATITWTTDEAGDSVVRYGTSPALGDTESIAESVMNHSVSLTGLLADTPYYYEVETTDGCGNPVTSPQGTFTTEAVPPVLDISGWTLQQYDSSQSHTFPAGTEIPADGYLVIARDATQAAFEAEWGALPAGVVYVNSGDQCPMINGGESYELFDDLSAGVDGVTVSMAQYTSIQRNNPGDPPGVGSSWTVVADTSGTPGSGAGAPSGAGVVINEACDADDYHNDWVELYYDAGVAEPDTTAPSTVTDLTVEILGSDQVRLTWTAPGDDGTTGTAFTYDVRYANAPITTDDAFGAATALAGEPSPQASGNPEQWDVSGLTQNRTYYFSLKAFDEAANVSGLSNSPGGTTAPEGSGGPIPADHLVISEVQARGASDHDDEFIELYNPTDSAVSLSGWSLQYKSASGSTFLVTALPSDSIPSHGYYLAARTLYTGSTTPDHTWSSFAMGSSGGHVFLASTTSGLSSCDADPAIVDRIGWGSANCPEGTAPSAHGAGESLERKPGEDSPGCGNGTDSDDNDADFDIRSPSEPQNSMMSESPCGGAGLGSVGFTLFWTAGSQADMAWAAAYGATGYKVRRSALSDFMVTNPIPDDTYLLASPSGPTHTDGGDPGSGVCWFYFVNATDGSGESDEAVAAW